MRTLSEQEIEIVSGGMAVCTPTNTYAGITDTGSVGRDFINLYEGAVWGVSYVIERVANAL